MPIGLNLIKIFQFAVREVRLMSQKLLLPKNPLSQPCNRRQFLRLLQLGGLGTLLSGCGVNGLESVIHQVWEPVNRQTQALLFNPEQLAPEFPESAIQPEELIVNDVLTNSGRPLPQLDPQTYRLQVGGEVTNPRSFSLAELRAMPPRTMTIRHVCVEGWAAIVQWTGVPLAAIAELVQPLETVRYVYFRSAENYYESWDLASALHPQTLMVYGKNGGPLPVENGAPLRLASPIKLGYKQSKWVTEIAFLRDLPRQRGYWEDRGYEWFAGL